MLILNRYQSLNFRSNLMKIVSTLIVTLFAVVGSHNVFAVNPDPNNMTQEEILTEIHKHQLAKPLPPRAEVKKQLQDSCPGVMKNKTKAEALISLIRGERRIEIKDEGYIEECDAEYERRNPEGLTN
jgi:hypothetical protein